MLLDEFGQFALTGNQFVEIRIGFGELVVDFLVFLEDVDNLLHTFLHHLLHRFIVV